ncbi:GlsB/YeaQ/YmgE family stress response membrane protein [Nocardioides sp.]|uniref:GlsB/YeaQ/YmgE family stress response membrane protein n=1 Tax=Nocardioides sp. TaxID=35761 RepID=UPI002D80E671|nr:GlsB/YeaQ/YmgE family stress response membrane protein [Nocardioides sp.]HET8961331.1 GlsB/YeaQ/YmgE family stress response membrane protein [Nocardioides sp.]
MLIIAIILFGMLIGAGAQMLLGRSASGIDWPMAFASGLLGSLVGGLLASLLAGDGLELRLSGIVGSLVGAVIVTALWQWLRGRRASSAS